MCVVCITVASVAAVAVSLSISGCSKSNAPAKNQETEISNYGELSKLNLPDWVLSPYAGLTSNTIAGVGISKKPSGNEQLRFLLKQAESSARAEIATTLQTEISRIIKDATQSADINETSAIESSFSEATTEIVKNVPLSGAVRDKVFQDQSGVVYVRMVVNSKIIKQYLVDNIDAYSSSLEKNGATRDVIQKTQNSLKNLFNELDLKTNQPTANSSN